MPLGLGHPFDLNGPPTMDCFNMAHDALNAINTRGMTADQALARAQILALLSISQELSSIYHHGINPEFTDVD